ncbi:MAG: phosphopantetheine-binding protein [Eubacteriales bacterium]|nr:phosphopantetheine-binding protein [Eubacteriales bacterium]
MIFDELVEIFKRVMPQMDASKLKPESVLTTDIGIDSLNMMLLAITVEDQFGIKFEAGVKLDTVSDIMEYIEKCKES